MSYSPRLKDDYSNKIIKDLQGSLDLKNVMQVPSLEKIVISKGVGAAVAAIHAFRLIAVLLITPAFVKYLAPLVRVKVSQKLSNKKKLFYEANSLYKIFQTGFSGILGAPYLS